MYYFATFVLRWAGAVGGERVIIVALPQSFFTSKAHNSTCTERGLQYRSRMEAMMMMLL